MKNFSVIRSNLEYGHKVEVKNQYGVKTIFLHSRGLHILDSEGIIRSETNVNDMDCTSITPIPHRYKKLEVGTKVDVLEEYDNFSAKLNPYKIREEGKCSCHVKVKSAFSVFEVPLWAITPHVEEEKEKQEFIVGGRKEYLSFVMEEIETLISVAGKTYKVLITEER